MTHQQNQLKVPGLPQGSTFDSAGLPTIYPAPSDNKAEINAQYQQMVANNNAVQQLLFLNSLTNHLASPFLANSLANPLMQAQLMANAASGLMGVQNTMNPTALGQLS